MIGLNGGIKEMGHFEVDASQFWKITKKYTKLFIQKINVEFCKPTATPMFRKELYTYIFLQNIE
jgi:hypothetical protein